MATHYVTVSGIPPWADPEHLLGDGEWTDSPEGWTARLDTRVAADLAARLRGLGLGGNPVEVHIAPRLKRPVVRQARLVDARRRRDTTPGFLRKGARFDEMGRRYLTPEILALDLGRAAAPRRVLDACCGAGGNALGFARAGCDVLAVELDPDRLADARHNATLYDVADRISFTHGDVRDIIASADVDLVFADPPWGEDWDRRGTALSDLPLLAELIASAQARGLEVWAKVPPSFDPASVPRAVAEAWYGRAAGDAQRVKFVLLRIPATML